MKKIVQRLFIFKEMHSFQVIALVGLIMSVLAHVLLLTSGKTISSFGFIYPTWVIVFIVGFLLNLSSGPDSHGHHH